ncbi:MAG: AAA family ATPase [Oscillibacter sp.]|nr:AAA family ATPase [Oscillibacter sp.]MBQ4565519.1 AAA family ATPase [Oscillospiraceae bacterium]
MKSIVIEKLTMENFKCHRHFVLELGGRSAALFGDNATGKSSVYDALTWLLFGKDSKGNGEKNIDIKPLDQEGNVKDHEAVTAVEAVFSCDGEQLSLKRTLREVWATKRGSSTLSFEGNTSDYYVNRVPCKKYEFERRIAQLFGDSEKAWRVLTSVGYFASEMEWKERRRMLFDLAGIRSDKDIMETDKRFVPLMEAMGKLTVDDYRKVLNSQRKGLQDVRRENPAKLEALGEVERELQQADLDAARVQQDQLNAAKETVHRQLAALGQEGSSDKQEKEILQLMLELSELESENRAYREEQLRKMPDVSAQKRSLVKLDLSRKRSVDRLNRLEADVRRLDAGIAAARDRWIGVNGEIFQGGDCPVCGQTLPMEQLMAAKQRFEAQKQRQLDEIQRSAEAQKEAQAQQQEEIRQLKESLEEEQRSMELLTAEIQAAEMAQFTPKDLPDYAAKKADINGRIAALEAEKQRLKEGIAQADEELRSKLRTINQDLKTVQEELAKEQTLRSVREKMELLRQESRKAAAEMERLDGLMFLMDEFLRYKVGFVEDTVNDLFKLAKFRLFREQANGGVEERCDVTLNGVPYESLNSGAKINVGIDLINTLSEFFGLQVPLFIDNAESVTSLEKLEAQRIRLVVSEKDKELRCEYEN